MPARPVPAIALATDFGLADAYVGMMRGVIAGINPDARVIDLTHGIGAQDVRHGAAALSDSYRYFPPGSVFVGVVDPGVGTQRAAILLETPAAEACFLAPDNGLLTLVCRAFDPSFGDRATAGDAPVPDGCRAWRLTNPSYWRHPVSHTFHGRDVFAPAAAHRSLGVAPETLGEKTDTIVALALPPPRPRNGQVLGQVIYADAFGNLVTDITADIIANMLAVLGIPAADDAIAIASATVDIAGQRIAGLARAFHDPPAPPGSLRALVGSHGRLEVAVVDGSAASTLAAGAGAPITLTAYPQRTAR